MTTFGEVRQATSRMTAIEHPLLVLTPRPWKWLGILAVSLVLGFGGWLMINDTDDDPRTRIGWFCLVLFGLAAVVAIIQLIPGSSSVVVTSKGIYQTAMYRRSFFPWTDIERFGVAEWTTWHGPFRQRHRLIGIRFTDGSEVREKWRRASVLSEGLVGYHGALSDNYGYDHQELADRLNGYLKAAHRG